MNALKLISRVNTTHRAIAFTFDDGPDPEYTRRILDIFHKASGHATFFMIGRHMVGHSKLVRTVHHAGHEIGNHTYTHVNLTKVSTDEAFHELTMTAMLIEDLTGVRSTVFRPPFLAVNREVELLLRILGYRMFGAANLDAKDWDQPGTTHIYQKSKVQMNSGNIMIFHDGLGDRRQTVEAVRLLVDEAVKQGYQLVTLSKLMELEMGNVDNRVLASL